MTRQLLCALAAAFASLLATATSAFAHPHVWVTMRSEVVYAADGTVTGIRHAWTFDDMFSAFATQGIDSKKRGVFTREELMPLAKVNIDSLKDFDYFTYARVNGEKAEFSDPLENYYLDFKDQLLTLHFVLPLKQPAKANNVEFQMYDQSYFVDFSFDKGNPVALVGAPATCKLVVVRPEQLDAALAQQLSQLGADAKLDPSQYLGTQFANRIFVRCT